MKKYIAICLDEDRDSTTLFIEAETPMQAVNKLPAYYTLQTLHEIAATFKQTTVLERVE